MGFATKATWAVLLYNLNLFALCEYQTDLIKNITVALSSHFHINCFVIFQRFNASPTGFDTFKALSSDLRSSVVAYTFEDRRSGKWCPRPMNLIIGKDLTREFAGFANGRSMAGEIWVVFLSSPALEFFKESRPSFDSEVVAAEILSPQEVHFQEVYSVDDNFPLRIVEYGNWTSRDGLSLSARPLFDRRSDLEGKIIRVGSNENWPICTFSDDTWDGLMPRIWQEIEPLINCTTVPVRSKDNSTGLKLANGTWNGLMGMLIHGDIDVIAAELSLTKARTRDIKFGHPALNARYQIYFKGLGYRLEWKAIFKPFALSTWLALCGWTVVASTCISASYYWCIKSGFKESENVNFTKTESFFFILQSLCQQGYPFVPKSLCSRIVFVMAYALSTIMIPSYSASLISSLTYQTPIKPFDSLEAMVLNGKYKLLVKRNSAAFSQFSQATDPLYMKAYATIIDRVHTDAPLDDSVQVLDEIVCKKKNYALFGIDSILDLKMKYRKPQCSILKLGNALIPIFVGLGMRKDSPYSRLIDYKLQKLVNIGAMARLKSNFRPLGATVSSEMEFRQVEVDETFQMFVLLLFGMIISGFILIVEKIMWKRDGRSTGRTRGSYVIYLDFYVD